MSMPAWLRKISSSIFSVDFKSCLTYQWSLWKCGMVLLNTLQTKTSAQMKQHLIRVCVCVISVCVWMCVCVGGWVHVLEGERERDLVATWCNGQLCQYVLYWDMTRPGSFIHSPFSLWDAWPKAVQGKQSSSVSYSKVHLQNMHGLYPINGWMNAYMSTDC